MAYSPADHAAEVERRLEDIGPGPRSPGARRFVQAVAAAAVSPEERANVLTSILSEELTALGTPLPPAVARAGPRGVDKLAGRLLEGNGAVPPGRTPEIQSQAIPPDRYRQAVRDVLELLRTGRVDLRKLRS
jgi:hypothetical protein